MNEYVYVSGGDKHQEETKHKEKGICMDNCLQFALLRFSMKLSLDLQAR